MSHPLQFIELFEEIPEDMRKVFIGMGTYKDVACRMISPHFETIHVIGEPQKSVAPYDNIELDEDIRVPWILVHLGDSIDVLPSLYEDYKDGAVFYMDAHVSDWEPKPDHQTPLLKEIEFINKKPLGPSLFIVDDMKILLNGFWQVCSQFRPDQIKKAYEKNDRYWIFTNQTFEK
jgi:hypothetical protein